VADQVDNLGLDASQLMAELARVQAAFNAYNQTLGTVANTTVELEKKKKIIVGTFQQVTAEGERIEGTLKRVNGQWQAQVKSVKEADNALKEHLRTQAEARAKAGASAAQQFLQGAGAGDVPPEMFARMRTVQQQLAKALAADPTNVDIAKEIFEKMKQGVLDVEVGIRGKIQAALLGVLDIQRRITNEQQKQSTAAKPAPNIDAGQLGALRSNILGAYPVPTTASIGSILGFQAALNSLIALAARGKIPFQDLIKLFNDVSRNPRIDFAGSNAELQKAQTAVLRLQQAFKGMQDSAKAAGEEAGKSGRSFLVTFDQLMRILEIQVVHRVFGNLITGMQNSVGAAAELQVKISEIRTISQGTGLGFADLQGRVRALSEEFGRPQVDVAEAMYQGFSNQVIKTAGDMSLMNEVLRFSRIAVTDATSAMNLLSNVINAYGRSTGEAREISDQLFKAIEIGRFRAQDVANTLGRVTVVASEVGVKLPEVLGLLANLTRQGVSPAEAMTQISGIMQSLIRPSAQMSQVLRQWGVDSGVAAVQTFGFIEVLRRLNEESQRSGGRLGELLPNVRALRGIFGATQGGGTQGLQDTIQQIEQAREPAAEAFRIVAESAGDAFKKELIKIQNFFVNDFGNAFLITIQDLTGPFGGLSSIVKDLGGGIKDLVGVGSSAIKTFLDIVTVGGNVQIGLGTMLKLFIAYKIAIAGVTLAKTLYTVATAAWSAATLLAVQAESAKTATAAANAAATTASTVATTTNTVATGAQTAGLITAAVATNSVTTAQILAAAATRAWTLALSALPIIGVATAIAFLIGALDPLISQIGNLNNNISAMSSFATTLQQETSRATTEFNAAQQRLTNTFRTQLEERGRILNQELARIRSGSTELVDRQRQIVANTTNSLKLTTDAVRENMNRNVSEITKKISEAEENVKQSLKRTSAFADKTQSELFQRRLRTAALQPEFISNVRLRCANNR
jgi:TP901 family phage tail tape measure protein